MVILLFAGRGIFFSSLLKKKAGVFVLFEVSVFFSLLLNTAVSYKEVEYIYILIYITTFVFILYHQDFFFVTCFYLNKIIRAQLTWLINNVESPQTVSNSFLHSAERSLFIQKTLIMLSLSLIFT